MSSRIKSGSASVVEILARRAAWRVRLARFMGLAAVFLGLGIFGAFLLQSGFFSNFVPLPSQPLDVTANPDVISASQSRISGVDKSNQPYEISAATGVQDKEISSLVHLQTVQGVFKRAGDKRIDIASDSALYDTKTKDMSMKGNVVFEDPGRYKAQMESAKINLDDKSLVSQSPVHVDMETGSVDADSLEIMDNGKRSLFKGHVKARIEGDAIDGKGDAQ
jgi:lipopolysaccharide export system protein LptC